MPDCASVTSRAIWASAVSAPTLRRADDQPAAGVDRRAGDRVARAAFSTGTRLAGEQRLVDGRAALLDDAVGRDLLARAHDEAVADAQLLDRDAPLRRRRRRAPRRPWRRARAARRARRPRGAWRAPRSSGPARMNDGHDGADLEVDLRRSPGPLRHELERHAHPGVPASPRNERVRATTARRRARRRLISVSIVAAPCLRFAQAARWNGQAPQRTTGVASCEREPLPAVELQRRDHRRAAATGSASTRRDDEAPAQRRPRRRPAVAVARGGSAAAATRLVAGRLDRADELLGLDRAPGRSRRSPSRSRS